MKRAVVSPRLLLGARTLSGVSLVTRDRALEVVARYRERESLAVTLSKAMDAGVDGVLAAPTAMVRGALAELSRAVPLYAVLPVLSEHDRHELEPGIEAVLARSRRGAGFGARARIGFGELLRPPAFFHGDLSARLPLLIEAEISALKPGTLRGVVIDAWLTDLALAAGHRRFFESTCRFVRARIGAAGFETHNLGLLMVRLREWGISPDLVVGPVNPSGLMMKPSPGELLEELARTELPVIAKELRAGNVHTLEAGARYAIEHHAYGIAPDLAELDDVASELKALVRNVIRTEAAAPA
jgi:hypothetical protein